MNRGSAEGLIAASPPELVGGEGGRGLGAEGAVCFVPKNLVFVL